VPLQISRSLVYEEVRRFSGSHAQRGNALSEAEPPNDYIEAEPQVRRSHAEHRNERNQRRNLLTERDAQLGEL
jgi:hypothetical protein